MSKFFSPAYLKPVTDTLNQALKRGQHPARMFEEWVNAMFYAHLGDTERYKAVLEPYVDSGWERAEIQDIFREAETQLVLCMMRHGQEVLTELCLAYSGNLHIGQYFSPFDVCKILASLTDREGRGGTTADYSCGAGRLLMGMIASRSPEANERSFYLGVDVDRTCAQMTALNLRWARVNGMAVWGTVLTGEIWEAWDILATPLQSVISPVPKERFQALLAAYKAER